MTKTKFAPIPKLSSELKVHICPIQKKHNEQIRNIILQVRAEFPLGEMNDEAPNAPALVELAAHYENRYWVVNDKNGKVYGGGGFAIVQKDGKSVADLKNFI